MYAVRRQGAQCADFYANFAGAGILVARDEGNNVLGRAVVWGKAMWNTTGMPAVQVSVLDRIYTSHAFVMDLIREQAGSLGINLRKKYNDYAHPEDFISMSQIPGMAEEPGTEVHARLSVKVPACRWHKKGVPYLDTFHYIHLGRYRAGTGRITTAVRRLPPASTHKAAQQFEVCMPQCGGIHEDSNRLYCNVCYPLYYTQTPSARP